MRETKRCLICGRHGIARVNDRAWLCEQHALEATKFSLAAGASVVWACRGNAQYLMVPTKAGRN